MNIFAAIFWLLAAWTIITLLLRIYWYKKERYGYASWWFEWLLACMSTVGVYVVAYDQPILNRGVWWLVLAAVVISTALRLNSRRFAEQVKQLTSRQVRLVKGLMLLYTVPIVIMLLLNASNVTGVWDN